MPELTQQQIASEFARIAATEKPLTDIGLVQRQQYLDYLSSLRTQQQQQAFYASPEGQQQLIQQSQAAQLEENRAPIREALTATQERIADAQAKYDAAVQSGDRASKNYYDNRLGQLKAELYYLQQAYNKGLTITEASSAAAAAVSHMEELQAQQQYNANTSDAQKILDLTKMAEKQGITLTAGDIIDIQRGTYGSYQYEGKVYPVLGEGYVPTPILEAQKAYLAQQQALPSQMTSLGISNIDITTPDVSIQKRTIEGGGYSAPKEAYQITYDGTTYDIIPPQKPIQIQKLTTSFPFQQKGTSFYETTKIPLGYDTSGKKVFATPEQQIIREAGFYVPTSTVEYNPANIGKFSDFITQDIPLALFKSSKYVSESLKTELYNEGKVDWSARALGRQLGYNALLLGIGAAEAGYSFLSFPVLLATKPVETLKALPSTLYGQAEYLFTPLLTGKPNQFSYDIIYNTSETIGKGIGFLAGIALTEGISTRIKTSLKESPTLLKYGEIVKASEPFDIISGVGKNIKASAIWQTIAFDAETFKSGSIAYLKDLSKVLKGDYEGFMTFKQTLPASLTAQELASQAAQAKLEILFRDLKSAGAEVKFERVISPDIFSETNRAISGKLLLDANLQKQVTGSTALASEAGFRQKFMELFGERKPEGFVGDIEQALRGYTPELTATGLVAEETSATLKAKVQLAGGAEPVYKTIKAGKILEEEKLFLEKGLNIGLDMEMLKELYGLKPEQQFALEAGLPVKGSTIKKLRDIQSYQKDLLLREGISPDKIRVYQGTTLESANKILIEGLKSSEEAGIKRGIANLGDVYLTNDIRAAEGYANRAVVKELIAGKKSEPAIIEVELSLTEYEAALKKQGGLGRLGEIKVGAIPAENIRIFGKNTPRYYLEMRSRGIITPEEQITRLTKGKETFSGSDIDLKAVSKFEVDRVSKQLIKKFEKKFPEQLEKVEQMKIKYSGVKLAEIGELTDYTGKEGKPPVGSFIETPTGKVRQMSESVTFVTKDILRKGEYLTPEKFGEYLIKNDKLFQFKASDLTDEKAFGLFAKTPLDSPAAGRPSILISKKLYSDSYFSALDYFKSEGKEMAISKGYTPEQAATRYAEFKLQETIAHEIIHFKTPNVILDTGLFLPYRLQPAEVIAFGLEKYKALKGFKNPDFIAPEIETRILPQTKGGKVNIYGTRFSVKGFEEPLIDVFAEQNIKLIRRYKETAGNEIEYITTEGKKIKVVKQLYQEFENMDRVANALNYEQVEGGAKHVLQSIKEGRYDLDSLYNIKVKGAEAYSAEKVLQFSKDEPLITITKEGERYVISKKPEIIPEGTEAADVVLNKVAEFYNKEVFPEIQAGVTEYATFGEKKVAVQSLLGGRTSKSLAASVREKYYGEFGKDVKDVIVGRVLDIERAQKAVETIKDVGAKQRFQAQINEIVDLFKEAEGRKPISSEADLTLRYIKQQFSYKKSTTPKIYKPLTETEFLKAQELKLKLQEKQYSKERLQNIFGNVLERETGVIGYKSLAPKVFKDIEKSFGKKEFVKQQTAQKYVNRIINEIQPSISSARKGAAKALQQDIEAGAYLRTAKELKTKYSYIPISKKASYSYVDYTKYDKYVDYYYNKYPAYGKYYSYGKYPSYNKYPSAKVTNYAPYSPTNTYDIIPYVSSPTYTPTPPPYIPTPPPYNPIRTIINPPPNILQREKNRKQIQRKLAELYALKIKKKGKFQTIRTGLERGEALRLGADIATKDIARTFKIVKTGQQKETFGISELDFMPSENIFRGYIVRKGKKISTPDQYIQRTSANLQSIEEKRQLKEARRLKKLINFNY